MGFAEALKDAVAVHNATPHSALGESPFKSMMGFEPTLPGWQKYRRGGDPQAIKASRSELRHRAMMRVQMMQEDVQVQQKPAVEVGDIIVYQMAEYEKGKKSPPREHFRGIYTQVVTPMPRQRGQERNCDM